MISVLQVSSYYQQFFESMIYESVKHNDNLLTEWHYFTTLLKKEPLDINRIQTYLGILGLKKATNSQHSEPNIDTDYEESESSSEDEQDFEEKQQEMQENNRTETLRKDIRKRKIANLFNEEEDGSEINRGVMVLQQRQNYEELPSKNYQDTPKRSTSSAGINRNNDSSELTHDNPSPILKEITSNFNNIQSSTNGHHSRKSILKQIIQNDNQTNQKESTYKSNSENIYNSIQSRINHKNNNSVINNADIVQQNISSVKNINNKKNTMLTQNSTDNNHQKGIINLQNSFGGINCSNNQGKNSLHSLQSSQSSTTNKQQKQTLSLSKKDLLKGLSINQVQITPTSSAPLLLKDNILGNVTQGNKKFTELPSSGKKEITLLKATPLIQGQISQPSQNYHGQLHQISNASSSKTTIETGSISKEQHQIIDQDNKLTTPKQISQQFENKDKIMSQTDDSVIEQNQLKSKDASSVKKSQVRVIYKQEDVTIPPSTPAILSRQPKVFHDNQKENNSTSQIPSTPPPQFKHQSNFQQNPEKTSQQQQFKHNQLFTMDQHNQQSSAQTSQPIAVTLHKHQLQPSSPNILPVSHTSMHSPTQIPQIPQQTSPLQYQQRQVEKKELLVFPSLSLKNQITGLLSLFEEDQIQINQLVSHNSSRMELHSPPQAALQHSFSHPQRQQSSRFPVNQLLYGPQQTLTNGINSTPTQPISLANKTKISPNITKQPQQYQLPAFIQQTSSPEIPFGAPIPVGQYKLTTQQSSRPANYTLNNQPFITSQCNNSASPMSVKGTLTQPLVQFRTGERSASHYSRETCSQETQSRTFFKRMKTFDNYALDTSQGLPPKCLNKTMDETLSTSSNNNNNHNNSFTRITMNTSKISVNQPVQQIHINNTSIHETNRLLTHSTNCLPHNEQNQSRKRGDYSFPDLKSFNKFIQR